MDTTSTPSPVMMRALRRSWAATRLTGGHLPVRGGIPCHLPRGHVRVERITVVLEHRKHSGDAGSSPYEGGVEKSTQKGACS